MLHILCHIFANYAVFISNNKDNNISVLCNKLIEDGLNVSNQEESDIDSGLKVRI